MNPGPCEHPGCDGDHGAMHGRYDPDMHARVKEPTIDCRSANGWGVWVSSGGHGGDVWLGCPDEYAAQWLVETLGIVNAARVVDWEDVLACIEACQHDPTEPERYRAAYTAAYVKVKELARSLVGRRG